MVLFLKIASVKCSSQQGLTRQSLTEDVDVVFCLAKCIFLFIVMFVRVFLCSGLVCKYIRKAIKTLVENTTHCFIQSYKNTIRLDC